MSFPIPPRLAETIVTKSPQTGGVEPALNDSSQAEISPETAVSHMVESEGTSTQDNALSDDDSNSGISIIGRGRTSSSSHSDATNSKASINALHSNSSTYSIVYRTNGQNSFLSSEEVKYLSGFPIQGEQYNSLVEPAHTFKANTPDLESIERFRERLKDLETDQGSNLLEMKLFLSDLLFGGDSPEDPVDSFPSFDNNEGTIPKEYFEFAKDLLYTRERFLKNSTSQITNTPRVNRRNALKVVASAAAAATAAGAAAVLLSRNSSAPGSQTVTQPVTQSVTPQDKRRDLLNQLSAAPDQSSSRIITDLTLEQALDQIESIDDLVNYRFRLGDLLDARSVSLLKEQGKELWQDQQGNQDLVLGALSLPPDTLKNDWKSAVAGYVKCFFNTEDFVNQIAKSNRNIGPNQLIGFANNPATIRLASKSSKEAPVIANQKYGQFSLDVDLDLLKRQMGKTKESGRLDLSGRLFRYEDILNQANPAI